MLVSGTIGSCSFLFRISSYSTCSSYVVPVYITLRSRLMWTKNWANNPTASNAEGTIHTTVLWIIEVSNSFLVLLNTWKLSSEKVHCGPKAENPCVLGSSSTCFVWLTDFKCSGIKLTTASLLLIPFFMSNPCFQRQVCNWRFDEIVYGEIIMYCQAIGYLFYYPVQLDESITWQIGVLLATKT